MEFITQPMMGSMQALSIVIKKVSANNFVGSTVLNLLHSQVGNGKMHNFM